MAQVCFAVSLLFLVLAVLVGALKLRRRGGGLFSLSPLYRMIAGVFLSAAVLFLPAYAAQFGADAVLWPKAVLLSARNAICLFALNGEFDIIRDFTVPLSAGWAAAYSTLGAVIYILAPILTLSFVVSFLLNTLSYHRLRWQKNRDLYVFSEINDCSLILAESLKKTHPKGIIVFHSVPHGEARLESEEMVRLRAMGSCCLSSDITVNRYRAHGKKAAVWFFAMKEDEDANIREALRLQADFWDRDNTRLYVFSTSAESELLFSYSQISPEDIAEKKGAQHNEQLQARRGKQLLKVRRVDPVRSLVDHTLFREGRRLFDNALTGPDGTRHINAVILGLGQYGSEMLKALAWYCQMDGFTLHADAFDRDAAKVGLLRGQCPELLDDEHNKLGLAPQDAEYDIHFHPGVDVFSGEFETALNDLPPTTYVLAALGSDAEDIKAALRLRMLCGRRKALYPAGYCPQIQAIVHAWERRDILSGIEDHRGTPYRIELLGDRKSAYDQEVIIDTVLEGIALERHRRWGAEADFWASEYNYRSSLATAIHLVAKTHCKIPGTELTADHLAEGDPRLAALQQLEHRRWAAYVRSVGYCFSKNSRDLTTRDDMARLHPDLTHFDQLLPEERCKDDAVALVHTQEELALIRGLLGPEG